MLQPHAPRFLTDCWYAAIYLSRSGRPCLIDSCTGTLSTTLQVRPSFSTSAIRCLMASTVQTWPIGTWCSAVTTPVAPACFTCLSVTGSFGPYQRHVCSSRTAVGADITP